MGMKKYLLLLFAVMAVTIGSAAAQQKHKVVEAKKFERKTNGKSVQLLDVRTAAEYETEHIPDALNADVLQDDFAVKVSALNKAKPVYIYCKSGKRSSHAASILKNLGFKKVIELKGGITARKALHSQQ